MNATPVNDRPIPSVTEILEMVGKARGNHLRAMIDAALDVVRGCDNPELQMVAAYVLTAAEIEHPEQFA